MNVRLSLLCLVLLATVPLLAQQRYTALYDYREVNEVTGRVTTDLIRLSMEDGYYVSLSENTYQKKLVQDSLMATGLDSYTIVAMTRDMARGSRTRIFTDLRTGQRTVYEFPMTLLHYVEIPQRVGWQLTDEEREVSGIASKLARGHLYGRDWIVAYAPDVPWTVGPWKLSGLPGLVTDAMTTDSLYHFTLVELRLTGDGEEPIRPWVSDTAPSKKQSKRQVLNALRECEVNNRGWLRKIYPVSSQPEETPEEIRRNALKRKSYQYIERRE